MPQFLANLPTEREKNSLFLSAIGMRSGLVLIYVHANIKAILNRCQQINVYVY